MQYKTQFVEKGAATNQEEVDDDDKLFGVYPVYTASCGDDGYKVNERDGDEVIGGLDWPSAMTHIEEIRDFFVRVVHCIQSIQQNLAAGHFTELWSHTRTVGAMTSVARRAESSESRECAALLESLHRQLLLILQQTSFQEGIIIPPTTRSGDPGRPRQRLNAPSRDYTPLSDECLMSIIRHILSNTPNAGETYVRGSLRRREIRVQRWRVCQVLRHIDPIGRCFRRSQAIRRRVYHVRGPNELW
ncbi:hypothetical protein ABVT39_014230 [Epinephelus coioides]